MKKLTLVIVTLLLCNYTIAQPITFEKIIDTLGCKYADCIKETLDGGYIIAGVSYYNNNDAAVVKLDSLGAIQWVKLYGGGGMDGLQRIQQLPDSGYLAMGLWNAGLAQQTWLLRLDANGDTLWTKKISGGVYRNEPQSMIALSTNQIVLTGLYLPQNTNYDLYLYDVDSLGSITLFKTFGDSIYSDEGYDITATYNNGNAITGANQTGVNLGGVYLLKTDSLNDTVWTRTYFHSKVNVGKAIKQTPDSGFVIAGIIFDTLIFDYNTYMIKVNSVGDTNFTRVYKHSKESGAKSIDIVNSKGYILTGTLANPFPQLNYNLLLLRTDEFGDTLWTRWYAGVGTAHGNYGVVTKDNGFICAGITGPAMYIIKTDSLGLVYTSSGLNEAVPKPDMIIHPNPSNGLFFLKINNINSSFTLTVSNAVGDVVKSEVVNTCNDYCLLDIYECPNGIYTVILKTYNKRISEKIVLVK